MVSLANRKALLGIARKQEETSGSSTAEKIDHPSIADYIWKAECFAITLEMQFFRHGNSHVIMCKLKM